MNERHPEPERGAGQVDEAAEGPEALVAIAAVIGAHGLRGGLRVKLYNPSSELLLTRADFALRRAGEPVRTLRVINAHEHGRGVWHLTVAGSGDRNTALALRGSELCVTRDELP